MPTTPVPPSADVDIHKQLAESKRRYWNSNLRIMSVLLFIWASAGFGASILFAEPLNAYKLPGTAYPLGFWFAQQGAIVVFVFVVLTYCILMNRLDLKHRMEMDAIRGVVGSNKSSLSK